MMYENELYHFGIPGMKWGKRRFQNYDGTLTDLGKRIKRETRDRLVFASVKSGYRAPSNFGGHSYGSGKISPQTSAYSQYRRASNESVFRDPNAERLSNNIRNTNRAFDSFYDAKSSYRTPRFGTYENKYRRSRPQDVSPFAREVSPPIHRPSYYDSEYKKSINSKTGNRKLSYLDSQKRYDPDSHWYGRVVARVGPESIGGTQIRNKSSFETDYGVPKRVASNYSYKKTAKLIGNYAKSSLSSFVTAARENSGHDFTSQLLADAERMRNSF